MGGIIKTRLDGIKVKTKLKVGDPIIVITGKEKGKKGKIKSINREKQSIIAENLNMVYKHKKPTKQDEKGEIIQIPAPIKLSNIQYYSAKLNKGIRLSFKLDSEGKKIRYNKKHDLVID